MVTERFHQSVSSGELCAASWLARYFAFMIDWGVLIFVGVLPVAGLGFSLESQKTLIFLFLFMPIFYGWFCESSKWQATLGKKMVGLIVRSSDGNHASDMQVFKRNATKYGLCFMASILFGIVLAIFIPQNQTKSIIAFTVVAFALVVFLGTRLAVHDLFAKTIVIRKDQIVDLEIGERGIEKLFRGADRRDVEQVRPTTSYPIQHETEESDVFVALLKSAVNENKLEIIPDKDLLEIYRQAKSISALRRLDIQFSRALTLLLNEIEKRRLTYQ